MKGRFLFIKADIYVFKHTLCLVHNTQTVENLPKKHDWATKGKCKPQ